MFRLQQLILIGGLCLGSHVAAQALEDPMRPPHYMETAKVSKPALAKKESWYLNSIMITPQRRVAVINGQRVTEGAWVGSARVVAIEATQVRLKTANRSLTLNLVPVNVKRYSRAETP